MFHSYVKTFTRNTCLAMVSIFRYGAHQAMSPPSLALRLKLTIPGAASPVTGISGHSKGSWRNPQATGSGARPTHDLTQFYEKTKMVRFDLKELSYSYSSIDFISMKKKLR